MELSEYTRFDAVGLADLVARGEVSAAELTAAAQAAIAAVNPRINAVVENWPAEDEPVPGSTPLAGVPFLIKDLAVAMAGKRVELGSRLAAGNVAAEDSFLMRRLRRAGLVTLGRTATPEFAYSTTTEPVLYGAARNPWDPERTPGGSTGGSAAAVAAGIVPMAHATDAAGSIRVPAASTGLFGLKPTRGRISMGPDADEVFNGLAVHGAISRTVRDSATLLDLIGGPETGDPYFAEPPRRPYAEEVTRPPGALRIGLLTTPWGGREVDAAISEATRQAARLLESLGHRVEVATMELDVDWEEFVLANARLWSANLVTWIDGFAAAFDRPVDESTVEPEMLASYAWGRQVSGADFVHALDVRNRVARSVGQYFTGHDLLLTPTLPELPLPIGTYRHGSEGADGHGWLAHLFHRSPFTAVFNVAGTPAMSVPLSADPTTGLPIGVQFAAGYGREDTLFRLAGQLEQAAPWAHRTPTVWAGANPAA
ncbi:amidase [Streptomyces rapamycinicus]|uniref:6-aminohexanoate hydrolase n=2 Tax=Streptomyces rapamycinicus TaxID=1226757 RepID=A0A0A0NFP7_STRRN|nr:amidase [Streptomyces rapamycinicus]AGP54883.1 6-aminohexanoate-dimer hydrolase [Streptomyces rapamycinicus NRRL 5491]MBB4782407.1 amidase [Streptomyces rapamycinicus]RLV82109.1 6-aminohexanoate hydrolase [Streptomyces rapamycinicus NRRL 5491]UTO62921.1 amidase [Streptomyces rapamycinicus]UTP30879.1 amidase [Streptomyces rapamycinicus NRRL 5491]